MSSDSEHYSSGLKVKKFKGQREEFAMWWNQFCAFCTLKGILEALFKKFDSKLPTNESDVLDPTDTVQKEQIKAKEMNAQAMSLLTMTMDAPRLIRKVESAKCPNWPGGKAWKLVEGLIKKYKPSDVIAVAEQATKLMSLKLKRTEDPEDLGDSIAALETEYGSSIDEKQKIAAIVKTAGQYYSDVIQNETARITGTGGIVTAEDLIEAMSTNWRIGGGSARTAKEYDDSEPNDVALSNMPGAFANRNCFKCGEKGHMARNCTKQGPNDKGGSFGGTCYACNKRGHKADRCWEHEKNAHLRPDGWKSVKGKEMAAVEILIPNVDCLNGVEFLLGSIDLNEEVTANCGGTGINMTAKRFGTSMKNVTDERCGMVNENNVTANSGGTVTGMTALWGSGIELKNEKVVTVQRGDGIISVNDLTAYERSGIKMTAKWGGIVMTAEDSGKNDEKVHWICEGGATMHRLCFRERENVNPEPGGVLEVENGARNVTRLDGFVSLGKSSVTKKKF